MGSSLAVSVGSSFHYGLARPCCKDCPARAFCFKAGPTRAGNSKSSTCVGAPWAEASRVMFLALSKLVVNVVTSFSGRDKDHKTDKDRKEPKVSIGPAKSNVEQKATETNAKSNG